MFHYSHDRRESIRFKSTTYEYYSTVLPYRQVVLHSSYSVRRTVHIKAQRSTILEKYCIVMEVLYFIV